jgi:HTH-type transcriptional regulator/antitoxin HigA
MAELTAYQSLLVEFEPRPIHSHSAYKRALRRVERLMKKPALTSAERDIVEAMSIFIEQFESVDYPTPTVLPHNLLAHLIEAKGVSQAEVSRVTGIARSNLSAILSGHRQISKAAAVKLGAYFGVSPALFLSG